MLSISIADGKTRGYKHWKTHRARCSRNIVRRAIEQDASHQECVQDGSLQHMVPWSAMKVWSLGFRP